MVTPRRRLFIEARKTARELYWSAHDESEAVCAACGRDRPLDVHHRDGDPLNNHPINLIGVCKPCHHREHRMRNWHEELEAWKEGFLALGDDNQPSPTPSDTSQPAVATDGGEDR